MGNTKKSTLKLTTQSLIVFGAIVAVMYTMGLLETFGAIAFFITALVVTLMVVVIFL